MVISENKMQIVIDNYFKSECDINTSIRSAFEKGFRIGVKKASSAQPEQKIGKFVRWMEKRETPKCISYTPHCKCSLCGNELFIENINYCYMCGARLIEDKEAEKREE